MAEAAVSLVVERLSDVLACIELHRSTHKQVRLLQDELQRMRCFLRDADSKQDEDERVRNWVSDIRSLAYDLEDTIDLFILKIQPLKKKNHIKRSIFFYKEWKNRTRIADDVQSFQMRLRDISASRELYGIRNIGESTVGVSETLRKLRRSSPREEVRDLVGLEDDSSNLIEQLIQTGDPWRAISIVGMGGIGKTTLARKVFNHGDIRTHFPSRAWIYVSQKFSARVIQEAILRQIGSARERLERLTDEEVEDLLNENLRRKRYLVVVDDIWWNTDWDRLAKAFPDRCNGSRLLLTTRNKNVALHADSQTDPYHIHHLNKDNSWELFCKKAFTSPTHSSPLLEEIGREIVERCAGLPLAIIVIGGLLSRKRKSADWERVLNNMESHFARDPTGVSTILALSYIDLPYHLKSCFLFLGQFPEDYSIPTHRLFRLWVAEGLIPHHGDRMEDVAEDYLNELIERNMVQVATTSANDRVKQCRLHDLLRELAISKAKMEDFLQIPGYTDILLSSRSRRCPIYSSSHFKCLWNPNTNSNLRTLLFFGIVSQVRYRFYRGSMNVKASYALSSSDFDNIIRSFKLLRILELEGVTCSRIPSTIGKLIHLKYLGLKETNVESLPPEIGCLINLQTLDIARNFHLAKVPNVISCMTSLRHLYMSGYRNGYLHIDTLKNLQTVSSIHADGWMCNTRSANLICLRKLGIRGSLSTRNIFGSLADLKQLQSLKLHAEGTAGFSKLDGLASLMLLSKLHLKGKISEFPTPQHFPPNLSQITLEYTCLEQDSISVLEKLPNLVVLRLKARSYSKEELGITANGFHQLELLELSSLVEVEQVNVEEGAMTRLRSFRIVNCKGLKMVPEELKSVTSLQELHIEEMPKVFIDRLRGHDFHKVQHIPIRRLI
ncbi:Disease resistance protein (CC-NBS-LRR class) family [Euphorbia peplus]|nr:Disease resistance protein (CC-NBS-LRR class) family [Euphorbia peplus]